LNEFTAGNLAQRMSPRFLDIKLRETRPEHFRRSVF
jgi:hypothetical protein